MSTMAAANYNEVYNAITQADGTIGPDPSKLDPMFCWDTHFPERLSRLSITPDFTPPTNVSHASRRNVRNRRNRSNARFKTQPITFDEIKEVDEDSVPSGAAAAKGESKENLKTQFTVFSRSMDGLVVSPFSKAEGKSPLGPASSPQAASGSPPPAPALSAAEQKAANMAAHIQSASIQRQQFRQRRKQRHTKSIEEAPELDRLETADSTG